MATPAHHAAWSEQLLTGPDAAGFRHEAKRLAVAVLLSSLFGVAIGLRSGGIAIVTHALGVSLGIVAVCALAVPALAIMLALANAPIDALGLSRATSRAAARAGLLLAGLAPGAALFAVTVEDAITVTCVTAGGLALAGLLAMQAFASELGDVRKGVLSKLAVPTFLVFAAILAARIWWVSLPLLRGSA